MSRIYYLFVVLLILACWAMPALASEFDSASVVRLLQEGRYKELDQMAERYRTTRETLKSGKWAHAEFYNALTDVDEDGEPGIVQRLAMVEKWAKASPDSPAPLVCLSDLYRAQAFAVRGSGWAKEVSNSKWERYNELMKKAWDAANNPVAAKDIRSYSEKINIIRSVAGDEGRNAAFAIFNEGVEREPDYQTLYSSIATMLMERWGGRPGELTEFYRQILKARKGPKGKVLFLQSLTNTFSGYYYHSPQNFLPFMKMSWEEVEAALKGALEGSKDPDYVYNFYWLYAAMSMKLDKAAEIQARLDANKSWILEDRGIKRKTMMQLREAVANRKNVEVFRLDLHSLDNYGDKSVEYNFINTSPTGTVTTSSVGNRKVIKSDFFGMNEDVNNYIDYVVVPNNFLSIGGTLEIKVTNLYSKSEVKESRKIAAVARATSTEGCPKGNILKSPSFEEGIDGWSFGNNAGIAGAAGGGKTFYMKPGEVLASQDVHIPAVCKGTYIAFASYATVYVTKNDKGGLDYYMPAVDLLAIVESGSGMDRGVSKATGSFNETNKYAWTPLTGSVVRMENATLLKLIVNVMPSAGGHGADIPLYFDDFEVRIFGSAEEANAFIESYKASHPSQGKPMAEYKR